MYLPASANGGMKADSNKITLKAICETVFRQYVLAISCFDASL